MQKDCEILLEEVTKLAFEKFGLLSKIQKEYVYNSLKFVKENKNHWNILSLSELKDRLEVI